MAIPQNIEELAHKVRTEIYGRDVREALASSMEATAEVAEWSREVAQQILDGAFDEAELIAEIENKLNQLEQDYAPKLTSLETEIEDARGGESNLGDRLNDFSSQLAQIATNVKNFGAIGDGESHPLSERFTYLSQAKEVYPHAYSLENEIDWCAIQSAVNFVVEQGGGLVFLPPGRYVTSDTIELESNVELAGAGMYLSTFFPNYLGANVFQNLIRANGSDADRMKNVIVRDFGIDGSNVEGWQTERGFEVGQWARINVSHVDNFIANNIYCYSGSHVFQMYGCKNFIIDTIRCDYNFNVVHLQSGGGENKEGIINNINATRVTTVVDFGGGGSDITVSNISANNEGYPRNNEEAFDIGGAKNIKINNAILTNFATGANLKGEGQVEWDNVQFNNCTFRDFTDYGIRATKGDIPGDVRVGNLKLIDCTFISKKMTLPLGYAIETITSESVNLTNVKIDVNQGGVYSAAFSEYKVSKLKIKAEKIGFYMDAPGSTINGTCTLEDLDVFALERPVFIKRCEPYLMINNFKISGALEYSAMEIQGTTKPILKNGLVFDNGGHGIQIKFDLINISQPNTINGLLAELTSVVIRDWGSSKTFRQGLAFTVPSVTGDFKGLRLKDLAFEVISTQNSQIGISWSGFSVENKINYSLIDGITFYRVPTPESQPQFKGANNVGNIVTIS